MDFELQVNETIILPVQEADTSILVDSPLYNLESFNTTEARILSATAENGNEHTVQKLSNESLVATKVPEGQLTFFSGPLTSAAQPGSILARMTLKALV